MACWDGTRLRRSMFLPPLQREVSLPMRRNHLRRKVSLPMRRNHRSNLRRHFVPLLIGSIYNFFELCLQPSDNHSHSQHRTETGTAGGQQSGLLGKLSISLHRLWKGWCLLRLTVLISHLRRRRRTLCRQYCYWHKFFSLPSKNSETSFNSSLEENIQAIFRDSSHRPWKVQLLYSLYLFC